MKYHQGARTAARDGERPRDRDHPSRRTRRTSRPSIRSSREWCAPSRTAAATGRRRGEGASRPPPRRRGVRGPGHRRRDVFNLAQLPGYRTGGTIHLIVNNQIGFTTSPASGRSSLYSTDVAKINQVPIFHVNGDDPEAACRVLQIALDYRQEFHKDVVIDLIGFRRHGHNEGDEPTYTQPVMYRRDPEHPGVADALRAAARREGVMTEAEVAELEARQVASLREARSRPRRRSRKPARAAGAAASTRTSRPRRRGADGGRRARRSPASAARSRRCPRDSTSTRRWSSSSPGAPQMAEGELPLDWGTAEALAFGSLAPRGDAGPAVRARTRARGTFSQRHVVFHDTTTGDRWTPLCEPRPRRRRRFAIYDSPLSEVGGARLRVRLQRRAPGRRSCSGRRSSATSPTARRSSSISSSRRREDKWQQTSRLGAAAAARLRGPGAGALERAASSASCSCARTTTCRSATSTTPAQYFHLLRRQMRQATAKPLVVITPKSLLRLPASFSPLEELTAGGFRPVLDDPDVAGPAARSSASSSAAERSTTT